MTILKNLKNNKEYSNNNIIIEPIWRDTLPAGDCDNTTAWEYHKLFNQFNMVIIMAIIIYIFTIF